MGGSSSAPIKAGVTAAMRSMSVDELNAICSHFSVAQREKILAVLDDLEMENDTHSESAAMKTARAWGETSRTFMDGSVDDAARYAALEKLPGFFAEKCRLKVNGKECNGSFLDVMAVIMPLWAGFKFDKPDFSVTEGADGTLTLLQHNAKSMVVDRSGMAIPGTERVNFEITQSFTMNSDGKISHWDQEADWTYVDECHKQVAFAYDRDSTAQVSGGFKGDLSEASSGSTYCSSYDRENQRASLMVERSSANVDTQEVDNISYNESELIQSTPDDNSLFVAEPALDDVGTQGRSRGRFLGKMAASLRRAKRVEFQSARNDAAGEKCSAAGTITTKGRLMQKRLESSDASERPGVHSFAKAKEAWVHEPTPKVKRWKLPYFAKSQNMETRHPRESCVPLVS